jgi:rhodanese-related sulfurtransferase
MTNIKQLFSEISTKNIAIVDVRTHDERRQISIQNTLHIPLDELPFRTNELVDFDEIHFFCKAGVRAKTACIIGIEAKLNCFAVSQGVFEIAEALS